MTKTASYHIYLEDRCLFKNLNEEEFDLIWDKIYRSYWKEDLTYSVCFGDHISDLEPSFWSGLPTTKLSILSVPHSFFKYGITSLVGRFLRPLAIIFKGSE